MILIEGSLILQYQRSRSSVYYFFKEVTENHSQYSREWRSGDWLYLCSHCDKAYHITPAMHGSVTGMQWHLSRDECLMYQLFEIFEKKLELGVKPTSAELLVASGEQPVQTLPYALEQQHRQVTNSSSSVPV